MAPIMSESEANLSRAQNLIDAVWQGRSDTFMARLAQGRPVERLPDLSEAAADRTASEARLAVAAIDTIDLQKLPHQLALTLKLLRFQLQVDAQAHERYWLAQDLGFFPAMFCVGPYGAGYFFSQVLNVFTGFHFSRPGDRDRYLALVEDYAGLLDQMREKIAGQAARGIRIPQPALTGMQGLIASRAQSATKGLRVDASRLPPHCGHFADNVARRVDERVMPAFAALGEAIGPNYATRVPAAVGMSQFNDGPRIYAALVAEHLSIPTSVEAVHQAGHERMRRIEAEMADIRGHLGYTSRDDFHRHLLTDHEWVAACGTDVQARLDAAISRIEPRIDELFRFKPKASYRAERLDPALEAGMTYGYYQEPIAGHPDGVYYFNGSNVSERTLATAASLIFHELIPGHHFHFASQKENRLLHPLRQNLFFNAFNEGWAEYAATLAGEIGMYADPHEQYGRLLMDAFLTCRLVVDTGLNALGWSLEQARGYMRERTLLSEAEIRTETLRYSTDIPAQSLAYKMGEIRIHELRALAKTLLGARFDIRDFHDIVLGSGGMPLDVLEWHVDRWLDAEIRQEGADDARLSSK